MVSIFAKDDPTQCIWSGTISLCEHDPFTVEILGEWIHADQIGVWYRDWMRWFTSHLPATLTPA
ncbi:MAG: hypothetical protein HYT30_00575 [Parcubacteria group bacterium]|nr:hypothetical protein [Parcubacteria group bacterium]